MRMMKLVSALCLLFALPLVAIPVWAGGNTLNTLKENFSVSAGYANSNHHLGVTLNKNGVDPAPSLMSYQKTPENLIERFGNFYSKMQNNGYNIKLGFGSGNHGVFAPSYNLDAAGGDYSLDNATPDTAIPYDPGHEDSSGPSFFLKFQFKF